VSRTQDTPSVLHEVEKTKKYTGTETYTVKPKQCQLNWENEVKVRPHLLSIQYTSLCYDV